MDLSKTMCEVNNLVIFETLCPYGGEDVHFGNLVMRPDNFVQGYLPFGGTGDHHCNGRRWTQQVKWC